MYACRFFYFWGLYPPDSHRDWKGAKDPQAWQAALKEDEEIREYALKEINDLYSYHEKQKSLVMKSIAFLESPKTILGSP
ncbi:MAG: hypothetical protein JSV05_02185 [Candidatus Bathyarchaeota archaeon]|nr:MAG: hypothetical protein JSV05_02185 [Candidatus Bathyarchaeota archaeon]